MEQSGISIQVQPSSGESSPSDQEVVHIDTIDIPQNMNVHADHCQPVHPSKGPTNNNDPNKLTLHVDTSDSEDDGDRQFPPQQPVSQVIQFLRLIFPETIIN